MAGYTFHFTTEAAPRRGGAEGAAHARRLHAREPGRLARRVRGARRPDRPVPDGLGGAVPRRPVRRRDRFDPHLRSRHPAQPLSGARSAPAARARVPDGRAGAQRLSRALARALRGRPDQGAALQGHRRRHRHRRHRVLPAALLRRRRRPSSTTSARRATVVLHGEVDEALQRFWADTRERHRFFQHDRERPILAPEALFLQARGFLRRLRRARAARACARAGDDASPVGERPARPQRRPRRARAAEAPAGPRRDDAASRPHRRRERRPAREPARAAARQPHRAAERRDAGRVRGRRRALRDRRRAARARLRRARPTAPADARDDRVRHRDRAVRDGAGRAGAGSARSRPATSTR